MTKKNYQEFASMIKHRLAHAGTEDPAEHYMQSYQSVAICEIIAIANEMAVVFQIDNPRFDKIKFLTACGVISGYQQNI